MLIVGSVLFNQAVNNDTCHDSVSGANTVPKFFLVICEDVFESNFPPLLFLFSWFDVVLAVIINGYILTVKL